MATITTTTTTTNIPTIVFIPGAWHHASCYDRVRAVLASPVSPVSFPDDGDERKKTIAQSQPLVFPTAAVQLPSVAAEPPDNATFAGDVAAARSVIEPLVERDQRVVVLAHSYGGIVASEAVGGLGAPERRKRGEKGGGGVVMVVYLSAFVPKKGESFIDVLNNGGHSADWKQVDGPYIRICADPVQTFYHDVQDASTRDAAVAAVSHHSTVSFIGKVSHEGAWLDAGTPCAYIVTTADQCTPVWLQRMQAARLGAGEPQDGQGRGSVRVLEMETSHSPFLSRPEELARVLARLALDGYDACEL